MCHFYNEKLAEKGSWWPFKDGAPGGRLEFLIFTKFPHIYQPLYQISEDSEKYATCMCENKKVYDG
jgi:hypothetical protein